METNQNREVRCWCNYCKDPIYEGDASTTDCERNEFHPECFIQMNTYSDPYGNSNNE